MKRKIDEGVVATKSIETQAGSAKVNRKTSTRQQQQQQHEETRFLGRITRSKVQSTKGIALDTFVKMVNQTASNFGDVDASIYVSKDAMSDNALSSTITSANRTQSKPRKRHGSTVVSPSKSTANNTPTKSNSRNAAVKAVDEEVSSSLNTTRSSSRNKTPKKSIDFVVTRSRDRSRDATVGEISSNQTLNKCKSC